jgi:hypothetical protein
MIARVLTAVAGVSYLASCALGAGVASGRVRTGRARWVHHALYISTAGTTTAAAVALVAEHGPRGLVMAPVIVPLAAIPFAGTRGRRHPAIAATIAPFLLAGLLVARRGPASGSRRSHRRSPRRKVA